MTTTTEGELLRGYGVTEARAALVLAGLRVPACMTDEEALDWYATNDARWPPRRRRGNPCWDCDPPFAAEMRALGRCDGTPGYGS